MLRGVLFVSISSLVLYFLIYTFQNKITYSGALTPYYNTINKRSLGPGQFRSFSLPNMNTRTYLQYIFDKPFDIDDTAQFEDIRDELACVPSKFGYTKDQGLKLFPPYKYPECAEVNKHLTSTMSLDLVNNELRLNCTTGYKGRYILGPRDDRKLIKNTDLDFEVYEYPGYPVKLKGHEEYALASCEEEGDFNLVEMHPRFKQKVFKKAKDIGNKNGFFHGKPSLILHLVVDSFSRRHFYRKLTETVEFLNEANRNSTHAVFDFKLHNIHGHDSIENMSITLSGIPKYKRAKEETDYKYDIWNILRKQGYVTMIGQENCNSLFAPTLGERIPVDHSVNEFYCAAGVYSEYTTNKLMQGQHRCIGKRMSHNYILDYTWEFMETYSNVDKWIYLHLNAAHEGSGQHAATLDSDLTSFLKRVMKRPEVVYIFLEGDHGMRYGDWKRSEEASYEWKLPAFFLIMPHETLRSVFNSYNRLLMNTFRLTTKYDIRKTILAISAKVKNLNFEFDKDEGVVMFRRQIFTDRTCKRMGIPMFYCSCMDFDEIDIEEINSPMQIDHNYLELSRLIDTLARHSIDYLNQELFSHIHKDKFCQSVSFHNVTNASGFLTRKKEFIKLEVSVCEDSEVRFEALYSVAKLKPKLVPMVWGNLDQLIYYRGKKRHYRMIYLNRVDSFAGPCEKLSIQYDISAKYCVCKEE